MTSCSVLNETIGTGRTGRTSKKGPAGRNEGGERERAVRGLLVALSMIDGGETRGHCERVARYAVRLAREYLKSGFGELSELDNLRLSDLELGALLHDVGKISVPEKIRAKAGPLNPEEMAEMRRHVEYGLAKIWAFAPLLTDAIQIVGCHHEWFDGSGYPSRLAGREIPLAARIFSVVDAYDAMTSTRPYRAAMHHASALFELMKGAGTQFDPEVMAVFKGVPAVEWALLREREV